MRIKQEEEEGPEVQMAPLIDCVFLLLTFFLVATTLKKIDKELPLDLPEASAAIEVQQPDDVAVIAIDRDSNYYLNGTPISLSLLQSDLRTRGQTTPKCKIRLDVDRNVPFQRVMQVLDILRFEGLKNVSVNTKRDPAGLAGKE